MQIPGYKIEGELGAGGMAVVYLAMQESLHRQVALKVMTPGLAVDETYCHRFVKEGRILAQLTHPNLLTVFDIGMHEDHYYMASEYLPGGTVRDRINAGMDHDEVIDVVEHIAGGLYFAHSKGFVHRDVKPGNLLYRANGECVLCDFGIAKAVDSNTGATKLGTSIGTPHYMSPEQAKGEKVDHRTDIYSLGIVCYEMLCWRLPFDADDPFSVALMQINQAPPPLPDEHRRFQPLLNRMLAKDRDQRYSSGEELVAALQALRSQQQIDEVPAVELEATQVRGRDEVQTPEPQRQRQVTTPPPPSQPKPAPARPQAARSAPAKRSGRGALWMVIGLTALLAAVVVGTAVLQKRSNVVDGGESVSELMSQASLHLQAGRFVSPEDSNALTVYRRILQLEPNNAVASKGINDLAERVEAAAELAWGQGDIEQARTLLRDGLVAFPNDQGMDYLLSRIEAQMSEQQSNPSGQNDLSPSSEPTVVVTTPDADLDDETAALMLQADEYFDNQIFGHPPGKNATDVYLQVLERAPGNQHAIDRLEHIANVWADAARNSLRRGNTALARRMIEKGLQARPNHQRLQQLLQELESTGRDTSPRS